VEIGISSLLSWWAYIGAMIRMAPHGRTVAVPVMLGMGAPVPLLCLIGIAGVLVLKVSDPSAWLRSVGGPRYAVIALTFVAAANFGTAIAGIYASAIGLRNFSQLERLPWSVLLLLTVLPVALVGILIPDLFFGRFGAFLAFIGVAFAPLCGIQIATITFCGGATLTFVRSTIGVRPGLTRSGGCQSRRHRRACAGLRRLRLSAQSADIRIAWAVSVPHGIVTVGVYFRMYLCCAYQSLRYPRRARRLWAEQRRRGGRRRFLIRPYYRSKRIAAVRT